MRDHDARFRHQTTEPVRDVRQILDARHDVEHLPAAEALAHDRLAYHHRIVGQNEGAHGQPIHRRRRDDAHLAHAAERELQRARDGRCRQGQHVHVGAELLQPFLVDDAEMLLLVDHEKRQVAERDALAEKRVGADDDMNRAVGEARLGFGGLLGRYQPRQAADANAQPGEALAEGLEMLPRQQRRRHHHRDLTARQHRCVGRAQRHLGLAETDIAADQPIHGVTGREVRDRVVDRLDLVVGFGIGEARAELVVGARRRHHDRRRLEGALGRDLDQRIGHVAQAALEARLARLPCLPAQLVERRRGLARAVARQHLDVFDRHEEPIAVGIGEPEAIVRRAHGRYGFEPFVAPDAVIDMDHEIARRELGCVRDDLLGLAPPALRARQTLPEYVLLADDDELRRREAMLDPEHDQRDGIVRKLARLLPAIRHGERGHAMLGEQMLHAVARAGGIGGDGATAAGLALARQEIANGIERVGGGRRRERIPCGARRDRRSVVLPPAKAARQTATARPPHGPTGGGPTRDR